MTHAINHLKENLRVLFSNRHNVGWGYRNSDITLAKNGYRECQAYRRSELRSFIKAIKELRVAGSTHNSSMNAPCSCGNEGIVYCEKCLSHAISISNKLNERFL